MRNPRLVTFEQTNAKGNKHLYMRVVHNLAQYLLEHNEQYPELTIIPICAIEIPKHEADLIDGQLNGM